MIYVQVDKGEVTESDDGTITITAASYRYGKPSDPRLVALKGIRKALNGYKDWIYGARSDRPEQLQHKFTWAVAFTLGVLSYGQADAIRSVMPYHGVEWTLVFAIIAAASNLAGWLFVGLARKVGLPMTYADLLDKRLAEYDPLDPAPYRELQSISRNRGEFSHEKIAKWLDAEQKALGVGLGKGRFVNKSLLRDNAAS